MKRCLFSIVYVLRCLPRRGLSAAIRPLLREVRSFGRPLLREVRCFGRSAALSGQADINVCFLGCGAQWGTFAGDKDVRTACFARLRGAESAPLIVSRPGLRYACLGLEKGRLFEAVAAHSRVWPLRSLRLCEREGCALRASRVFEALRLHHPLSLSPGCATLARG